MTNRHFKCFSFCPRPLYNEAELVSEREEAGLNHRIFLFRR